jgi:hypothetical protein
MLNYILTMCEIVVQGLHLTSRRFVTNIITTIVFGLRLLMKLIKHKTFMQKGAIHLVFNLLEICGSEIAMWLLTY